MATHFTYRELNKSIKEYSFDKTDTTTKLIITLDSRISYHKGLLKEYKLKLDNI